MKIKVNRWSLLFIYLIFQFALLGVVSTGPLYTVINYSDEIICILLVVEVIVKKKYKLLDNVERKMLFLLGIFEVIGIFSGIIYQYQSIPLMLVDAFQCSKFLLYYFCVRCLTHGKYNEDFLYKYFNRFCRFLAVILFVLTIHDLLMTPFFEKESYRYFTYSIQLFYGHPTTLARICSSIIFILAYNCKFDKKNIIYILLLSIVMFFTLRSKAIASAAIILIIYILVIKGKMKSKFWIILSSICSAIAIGYSQLTNYYSHAGYARAIITADSLKIAKECFPLGAGFGSFASNIAFSNYSNLYVKLGYLSNYELGKDSTFLSDTFWPIIIAQTGIIGTFCFIVILLLLIIKIVFAYLKVDKYAFWALSSIIIYDLISSTSESAFFHPTSMIAYIAMALIVSTTKYRKNISFGTREAVQ